MDTDVELGERPRITLSTLYYMFVEHERRITALETQFGRLLFWSATAAVGSTGAVVGVVLVLVRGH